MLSAKVEFKIRIRKNFVNLFVHISHSKFIKGYESKT